MFNLLSIYKNHKENHEKFYLLGDKVPHNLNGLTNAEICNLFLYSYSFLGLNILEFFNLSRLKKDLIKKLDSFDNNFKEEHKWWFLALEYLKLGAEAHNLSFFTNLCETLQDEIQNLTNDEIVSYSNLINDSLSEVIGFDLRIRPHLDTNPNIYIYKIYRDLTLHSKNIISILKHNLHLAEIQNEDILREFALIDNIGYNYDKWAVIFDILTGQILSNIDKPSFSSNPNENLSNTIDLSLLNLYIDTDFIPENLSDVRNNILNLII